MNGYNDLTGFTGNTDPAEHAVAHAALAAVTGGPLRPGGLELSEILLQRLNLTPGALVLDAGCGNGSSLGMLCRRGMRALGLDISAANLAQARQRAPGRPLVRATMERLPLKSGSTDAVLCECALSLVPGPGNALREFRRVLKPGGALAVSDVYLRADEPAPNIPATTARCCLDGAKTRQGLETLIRDSGFILETWEDHSLLLARLAGQLIFSFGSMSAFWSQLLTPEHADRVCSLAATARPGYCVLIARKG